MIVRAFLVAFLLLVPAAGAAQDAGRLDDLFARLAVAEEAGDARTVERLIWAEWLRSGDGETDVLMKRAITAMAAQHFGKALEILDTVVARAPGFAEGWNKRATVLYLVRRFDESLADIERVLALEPRHFGAISGVALIRLAQGDKAAALAAVLRALEIYPLLPGARELISQAGGAADPI